MEFVWVWLNYVGIEGTTTEDAVAFAAAA